MANFRTHLTGGALIASAAAFACYGQGLCDAGETQALFTVGVAASLLPDIDADASKPVRAVFGIAGIVIGFLVAFAFDDRLRLVELVLVWAGTWLAVRFPLFWLFARHTVHRGVWHSLLMALVVALTTAIAGELFFGLSDRLSWLVGGFTLLGYVTHLVLDEAASVDLFDKRVKRSFGTALKPLSLRAWPASLVLLALLVLLIGISPDPAPVLAAMDHFGLAAAQPIAAHWPRW
jgi:hypothetical protein